VPNLKSQSEQPPSTDAGEGVRDAAQSLDLDHLISITVILRHLADQQHWRTAKFSASDVTTIRQALRTSQQSLNRIESELDKRT
jgi:hypothetical protein